MDNQPMLKVTTVNVNGIRAAAKKSMAQWLKEANPDILCLQEVRAPQGELLALAVDGPIAIPGGWNIYDHEATAKGRAGVAILSKQPALEVRVDLGPDEFDSAGRWIEADFETPSGIFTVVSVYVHSGEVDTPKQVEKYKFLNAMSERMQWLINNREYAVVVGDLNVGHTELDIKNWKGNLKNAGFLPEERAFFDGFANQGWVDMGRAAHPGVPGPYTWWSFRGQAFDTDAGWRIDYQLATPKLAEKGQNYRVDRAPSYDTRWTDHTPVNVEYDL
jgi:exodeoxyribonuclease-3